MELPDKLPGSDHGINDKFHENIWSGTLPKECFIPGSQISFKDGSSETSKLPLKVGAPTPFKMINLPFICLVRMSKHLIKLKVEILH